MNPINKSVLQSIPSVRAQSRKQMEQPNVTLNVPYNRGGMEFPEDQSIDREYLKTGDLTQIKTFKEAFGLARKLGLKTFIWHNPKRPGDTMTYGTRLAGESETKAPDKASPDPQPAAAKPKSVISRPQSEYYSQSTSKKTDSPLLNQILQYPTLKNPSNVAKFVNQTAFKDPKQKFSDEQFKLIEEESLNIVDNLPGLRNSYKAEVYKRANLKAPKIKARDKWAQK